MSVYQMGLGHVKKHTLSPVSYDIWRSTHGTRPVKGKAIKYSWGELLYDLEGDKDFLIREQKE
jgi:hypothetical protein